MQDMGRAFRALVTLVTIAAFAALAAPTATATDGAAGTGTYIVVLRPGTSAVGSEAAALARQYGGRVGHVYEHALRGFSITASAAVADALARNPKVSYVEADQAVAVADQATPTGVQRVFAPGNTGIGIDGSDDLRVDADVAVIDTGIDLDHPDLAVAGSISCLVSPCAGTGDDDHYHGTHVAGTIAALDNGTGVVGVAPGARLWAVKVLNRRGSGSTAGVIAGINWVAGSWSTTGRDPIEVANLSLGGGFSSAMNAAVAGAVGAGVTVVVAAGNSATDAATSSPASEDTAVTVSALADFDGLPGGHTGATCRPDVDDTFADFSNYGTVVDIIAPGVCINSTAPGGTYRTLSGTSMAAPHVAGAAALLRSLDNIATASELTGSGNLNWNDVDDPDSEKEPLLDVSNSSVFAPKLVASPAPPPPPPATGLSFDGSSTSQKSSWTAKVNVTGATPGSVVAGTWVVDGAVSGGSCTASTSGTCTINRRKIANTIASVTWTHTDSGGVVPIQQPTP